MKTYKYTFNNDDIFGHADFDEIDVAASLEKYESMANDELGANGIAVELLHSTENSSMPHFDSTDDSEFVCHVMNKVFGSGEWMVNLQ